MKMGRAAKRSRRALAGIVSTVVMFAILFTVGTTYFVLVESQNASYQQSLRAAAQRTQGNLAESLSVTTLLETDGDVGFTATDTSAETINVTAVLVISSARALLKCDGVGFPAGAGCANSTPPLWIAIGAGGVSPSIDTGYVYVQGSTVTVKVLTARGNTYSADYPIPTSQSSSSQSVTVALDNLKWVQLLPEASSLVQKNYVSNCNAQNCALAYNSHVTSGNILVAGYSWYNQNPPSTPTDTLGDAFTLGADQSVGVPASTALVQDKYTSNCNAASCGLAFSSNVASGHTLVYAAGWANKSPPSSPTDTLGDTFTLGESNSVTINPPTAALVQDRYNSNCNSATCSLAYSSSVTAGNTLVFGLGWYGTSPYVPVTVNNCAQPLVVALDGSSYTTNSGVSSVSASLTTQNSNDVIMVLTATQDSSAYRTVSSVSATGLTFSQRGSTEEVQVNGYYEVMTEWYAIASSPLSSASISVTFSHSVSHWIVVDAFGISGANTASPFDSNGALPSQTSTSAASITTSNSNDLLVGFEQNDNTQSPTQGTGWTGISTSTSDWFASEYKTVTSTQSALSVTWSNAASDANVMLGDAIQQGGCATAPSLNGSAYNTSTSPGTTISTTLTTSHSNDVIIVIPFGQSSSGTYTTPSVSDSAGLAWSARGSLEKVSDSQESGNYAGISTEIFYAIASSPLSSDTITITWNTAPQGYAVVNAFAVSAANIAAPFDPNSNLPNFQAQDSYASVTTSNANDFIFGFENTDTTATPTAGSGFTGITSGVSNSFFASEYKVVSSTQSGLSMTYSNAASDSDAAWGDAIQGAPSTATPTTFQQMVTWNPSLYSSYEATNLGNIRFCTTASCSTQLHAWLESCSSTCSTSGSTSTSATAWVQLTSSIASGSSTTIYMVFEATSVNFDDNYWGEAPTLSSTYAQYDNGANVFNFYDNFSGTSLDSNWQTVIYGGGTVTVSNGVTLSATSTSYNPILVSKSEYSPAVEDASLSLSSKQTASSTPGVFYATTLPATSGGDYGFQTVYRYDWAEGSGLLRILDDISGSYSSGTTVSYTLPSTYNVFSATWSATGSESFAFNYSPEMVWTNSGITYGSAYIGAASVQGGQTNIQWLRLRAVPPNNVMPTTSFGSVTTGNGSPSSPTDTLGDTFTLGVSNSIPVSSVDYYSYIWYATAASSGADTISVTFPSAVTGSVSIYELTGYSVSSPMSSTGSSTAGSTSPAVTSFTPASNSFVIGNVETSSSSSTYTAGSGYTLVGSCSSVYGCSEYEGGVGSATTVPSSLGASAPWVESAISFAPLSSNVYYSYIWYATAASSGGDTISANFGSTVAGSVSIYEISGVTATGVLAQTGGSTTSQSSTSVTSMTPSSGSVVIGNSEATSTTYTAGSGYTLSGSCSTVGGCGEYEVGGGSATTVPMSISPSSAWVESAVAFAPASTTYYSYIWYATAGTSGADTITASFGATVAASVSIYEITGYITSGALSSTGSSSAGSTTASVSSFTPASDSFIVANVESASSSTTYTAGSGFTLSGSCSSVYGCGEYDAGGGGLPTTVPTTLSSSAAWVEAAMSFSTPFNPQSGIQVGGYPTMGVPGGAVLVWEVTFTNIDPQQRSITIWPQSDMAIGATNGPPDADYNQEHYYIIDGLNSGSTTVNAYTSTTGGVFVTLQYNVPTILYFAATQPLGSTTQSFGNNFLAPFEAYFALQGMMSDGTLFGETIPYPFGIITEANAYTTPTSGVSTPTPTTVTVSCTSPCYFNDNAKGMVGWINSAGQITQLTTFTCTSSGNIPSGVTFQVPAGAANGFYTIVVTDYINSVFMTFQVT